MKGSVEEDQLSPEEFDALQKAQKKTFEDNQPLYSKRDMLSFAFYLGGHTEPSRVERDFEDWKTNHTKGYN